MQDAGQVSPDGRWRWDGRQWVPHSTAMAAPAPVLPAEYYPRPTNTLAIVSLVTGILAWVVFPVAGALVAVVTGHIARGQIRKTGESGGGLAMAGLIIGYVHLVVAAIAGLLWLALVAGFLVAFFGAGGSH